MPPKFTPLDYDSKWGKEVQHNLLELDFTFSPNGEICWNFLNSNKNEKNKQWTRWRFFALTPGAQKKTWLLVTSVFLCKLRTWQFITNCNVSNYNHITVQLCIQDTVKTYKVNKPPQNGETIWPPRLSGFCVRLHHFFASSRVVQVFCKHLFRIWRSPQCGGHYYVSQVA